MRAAGYIRVSTEEQVKHGWNLGADRERIETEAAAKGWDLATIYDDGGRQGDDPDRPGFNRMLAEADSFDVLIVRHVDRFSRSLAIYAVAVDELLAADVALYEFQGAEGLKQLDLADDDDRTLADMKAVLAASEKRKIKRRVRQAKTARALAGKPSGGKTPYGYAYADGTLVVNPVEAPVLVRMFELAGAGTSQRQISRILNAEGIPASKGGRWAPATVSRILRSPLYLGLLPRAAGTVPGQHDAIVDEALWQRVNRTRAMPERRAGGRPMKSGHLLTRGRLRCGSCGSAMIPVAGYDGRPETYRCIGRRDHGPGYCQMPTVQRQAIDEALLGELTRRYFDLDGTRDRLRDRMASALPAARMALEEAVSELTRAESRIARVVRGWQDEILSDAEYATQRAGLESELSAAQAAVEQAERQVEQIEATGATTDAEEALLRALADLHRLVSGTVGEARDIEALRTVVRTLLERVTLTSWAWATDGEIEAAGVPAGEGLYLLPKLNEGVADWSTGSPVIHRVAVPTVEELALSTCRTSQFSDALFAPIPVEAPRTWRKPVPRRQPVAGDPRTKVRRRAGR
jgi:DNA invertase Pin-like site-specific DNA recombinase